MDKNYIAAVDLGSNSVVVAVGSRAGNKIRIEDVVVAPSEGIEGGEVKNVESASGAVRKALDEAQEHLGIRISEVVTGISGSHIRCARHPYHVYVGGKDGEITAADVRALNDGMRNMQAPEGYRLMNIVPQHYVVDDQESEVMDPIGRFSKTLGSTFSLVIAKITNITRLEKALQKAGVSVARIFINPLAVAEAVAFPDEKTLGVAVVDLGAGTTDVCVYHGGIVRGVGVIPMGADAVNKDIQAYGIMERYVEELKTKYGCAVADVVDAEKKVKVPGRTPSDYKEISFRNLASIIEARMTDIVEFVMAEIEAAGYTDKLGAGIVLTGGAAMLQEIKTLFERRTGMEVRIAAPDVVASPESKVLADDLRASAAVGLLWQGLVSGVETKVEVTAPAFVPPAVAAHAAHAQSGPESIMPDEVDIEWGRPAKEKKPRRGFMTKIKDALNKAMDSDVLDDDTMI